MSTKLLELDEKRRIAILNASLKEFAQEGFDAASTNIIAKEAAISKPLLFHYVGSKKELFLFVYDYFSGVLKSEYYGLLDYHETDIFNRLHQSYILQIKLVNLHPWILEFSKLSQTTNASEINKEIEKRVLNNQENCFPELFDDIDTSKFRKELDIEKCKQIIYWSNIGFTTQLLDDIRKVETKEIDNEYIIIELDTYFDELKRLFYKQD